MKILVTGATGFLGRHLCAHLKKQNHQVTEVGSRVADLRKPGTLDQFNQTLFDRVFHLAAWTQAGDFCLHHPGEQWSINQAINTHVLDWWNQHQPQAKIIVTGTSCSYAVDLPMTEENYLKGEPIDSLYTYAMTKRMALVGLRSLQKQFGGRYLYVVPSTLYGAGYHTDGRQLHFIFDLIRKIISGRERGTPVQLWGDGYQKRELILVEDFTRAMLALDERVENEVVNIGGGEESTIRQFAEAICQIVGYDAKRIEYDETKYVGARSKVLKIEKLRKLVPELQLTPLFEGLEKTVRWFQTEKEHFLV